MLPIEIMLMLKLTTSQNVSKKDLFRVFLQNLDLYFNPKLKDNVNIGFSATACFFQILGLFI